MRKSIIPSKFNLRFPYLISTNNSSKIRQQFTVLRRLPLPPLLLISCRRSYIGRTRPTAKYNSSLTDTNRQQDKTTVHGCFKTSFAYRNLRRESMTTHRVPLHHMQRLIQQKMTRRRRKSKMTHQFGPLGCSSSSGFRFGSIVDPVLSHHPLRLLPIRLLPLVINQVFLDADLPAPAVVDGEVGASCFPVPLPGGTVGPLSVGVLAVSRGEEVPFVLGDLLVHLCGSSR